MMSCSSGDLSLGSQEKGQVVMMDQRKRKRMQSNRESARRSRMRKQNHLEELMAQVAKLRKENNQILMSTNITTQHYINLEAENSILRAQMVELSQRLESLNDILTFTTDNNENYNCSINDNFDVLFQSDHFYGTAEHESLMMNNNYNNHLWNLMYLNQQPIMASANSTIFQY